MNCTQCQKYLGAYADGELGVEKNLEVLDHLKMCPACVKRVASIQEMKVALQRVLPSDSAPPSLATSILSGLDDAENTHAAGEPALSLTDQGDSGDGWSDDRSLPAQPVRRLRFPIRAVIGLAAVLVIMVGIRDVVFGPGGGTAMAATVVFEEATERHRTCSMLGDVPSSFPSDREEAACCMRRKLNLRVVAPDLSKYGYEFVGADTCGLAQRDGAHLVYRHTGRPSRLSLFFVERFETKQKSVGESTVIDGQHCPSNKGRGTSLLLWQDEGQSCIACACGGVEVALLAEIAKVVNGCDQRAAANDNCTCPQE
ncbi:MAG: anti-sigma factor family protein [Phycisphaerae bacterium]